MHNYGPRYQCVEAAQAKVRCTFKNRTLSVSGFRCWQLQVPLRGHRDGSGWAWEPVTLQCTPFWSCPAAIPLFLAGTGYKVLFPCCTASLKKLLAGSNFQLDNNDGTFMECFQWLKALYNLIKEKHGMHKYTHTEKQTWWHNNTVIKWWTTPVHAKQYETHIYIYMLNHRNICVCSHMHAGTQAYAHAGIHVRTRACTHTESSSVWNWKVYYKIHCSYSWQHLLWVAFRHAYLVHWKTKNK